ncbi:hypothetical protein HMPREF1546_02308 [Oscillibacter sp. KLE 1745]|nr:hypothetical protein HMPREF1546_02308 [Oscillibacter sp. KLE 1745]
MMPAIAEVACMVAPPPFPPGRKPAGQSKDTRLSRRSQQIKQNGGIKGAGDMDRKSDWEDAQ